MTSLDAIMVSCFVVGILLIFGGCIIANLAAQEMRCVLNKNRAPEDQLRWQDAFQVHAQKVIDMYRAAYPDGPLYRKLVLGYYVFGIGTVLGGGSALVMRLS